MALRIDRRPISLKLLIYFLIFSWVIIAAFPFIWTVWGSFKVELDFFSISDWTYALTGERTKPNMVVLLLEKDMKAHG